MTENERGEGKGLRACAVGEKLAKECAISLNSSLIFCNYPLREGISAPKKKRLAKYSERTSSSYALFSLFFSRLVIVVFLFLYHPALFILSVSQNLQQWHA